MILKRYLASLALLFALLYSAPAFAVCGVGAGACFWIAGTGSSNQTAHWSASSGGGTCTCVPAATDTATIDGSSGGGTYTITASPTYASFAFTNVNKTDTLSLASGMTIGAAGTFAATGNSITNRDFILSSVLGTQRTITMSAGATSTTNSNADFQDIAFSGATASGASIGDALGNSGITSTAALTGVNALVLSSTGTVNWSAATWTSPSGPTTRVPLPQDDVDLGSSNTATTLTADMPRLGRNVSAANYLKTLSFASTPNTIFGNLTLGASNTISGTQALTLAGRGAQTITSNGKTFPQNVAISAFGGTYTFQDAFNVTDLLTISVGTLDGASSNATMLRLTSIGAGTRFIKSAAGSVWTVNQPSGIAINMTGTLASMPNFFGTIKMGGTDAGTVTIQNDLVYPGNLFWSSTASTGTLAIAGALTINTLTIDGTTARTVQFPNGVTQTVTNFTQTNAGTGGNKVTLLSDSSGLQFTLNGTGQLHQLNFLAIKDSNATGSKWCANNSTNTSNNTGWIFGNCAGGSLLPVGGRLQFL